MMKHETIVLLVISSVILGSVDALNFSPKGECVRFLAPIIKCKPLFLAEKARLVARNLLHGYAIKSNVRNFEVKLKFLTMFNIYLLS